MVGKKIGEVNDVRKADRKSCRKRCGGGGQERGV
jgi:hypothetical protein